MERPKSSSRFQESLLGPNMYFGCLVAKNYKPMQSFMTMSCKVHSPADCKCRHLHLLHLPQLQRGPRLPDLEEDKLADDHPHGDDQAGGEECTAEGLAARDLDLLLPCFCDGCHCEQCLQSLSHSFTGIYIPPLAILLKKQMFFYK